MYRDFGTVLIFAMLAIVLVYVPLFIQSLVDFSLHTPGISTLLMTILSMGLINLKNNIS